MKDFPFSARKKINEQGLSEFTYTVNCKVRAKLGLIILGFFSDSEHDSGIPRLLQALSEAHGIASFCPGSYVRPTSLAKLRWYLLDAPQSPDEFLDCIELSAQYAQELWHLKLLSRAAGSDWTEISLRTMLDKLNKEFLLSSVGYTLGPDLKLSKTASDALQRTIVEPALLLTRRAGFESTNSDFAHALQNLRICEYRNAATDARRAVESALKTIAVKGGWVLRKKDKKTGQMQTCEMTGKETIHPLLELAFQNGLIPPDLQSSFSGLRTLLESTVPPATNPSCHGSVEPLAVPAAVAEFAVASAGAAINLLIKLSDDEGPGGSA